ncbi:MAG: c-type cytochrome [Proteobacteria bacterium]|nr:c-type cytochrome [Pseudomonadota bacterium]
MRRNTATLLTLPVGAVALAIAIGGLLLPRAAAAQDGEKLFKTTCAACHSIGGGRLVGPDLQGVTERRTKEWLHQFIPASQKMVKDGDPTAVELFAEYNNIPMPDQPLTAVQVDAILGYVQASGAPPAADGGGGEAAPEPTPAPVEPPATPEQIQLGQDLFTGETRLAHGGPSCISCHDVTNDAIIGGGILARELTTVFGRLGGNGVRAILGSPPFPVMQAAYEDRSLEEAEVVALVSFLEQVSSEQSNHLPRDTGLKLAASGAVGTVLLLLLYSLIWGNRKRGSVNQAIYDRQVDSI